MLPSRWVDMTGRRKCDRAGLAVHRVAIPAGWSALKTALNLSAVHSPAHTQASFWLIGPLSDIDCLGVIIERQIRMFESLASTRSEMLWAPVVLVSVLSHPVLIIPPDTNGLLKLDCDCDCKMRYVTSCDTLFYFCFVLVSLSVWVVVVTCLDLLAKPCGCCNHVFLQGISQLPASAWVCWLGLLLRQLSGWSFEAVINLTFFSTVAS